MNSGHFQLPLANIESFTGFLERKIVVVSVFGKSSFINFNHEPNFLHELFSSFQLNLHKDILNIDDDVMCCLDGYFDRIENIIYLHLKGSYDVKILTQAFEKISSDLKSEGFLKVWSRLKHQYARAVMFLLSVSHLVLLCHPSHSLDLSYIHLLKAVSFVRSRYQSLVGNVLKGLQNSNEGWVHHGRLCSPRLLFFFMVSSGNFLLGSSEEIIQKIKRLEHALEDQIYLILRKIRLVKNICDRACFSIAPNDEFVYIAFGEEMVGHKYESLLASLIDDCNRCLTSDSEDESESDRELDKGDKVGVEKKITENKAIKNDEIKHLEDKCLESGDEHDSKTIWSDSSSDMEDITTDNSTSKKLSHSFQEFLLNHVRTAHKKGFYDNMGKYSQSKPYFELPSLCEWFLGVNIILNDPNIGLKVGTSASPFHLENLLSIELRFSNTRCSKVMPLAIVAYQENLPPHYTAKFHKEKVDHAISVFTRQARGPEMKKYIDQLKDECEKFWKAGRQMCEVLSLTRNPCTKPMHHAPFTHNACQPGETEHWNSIHYLSSCNCGIKQGPRADPFTIRAANFEFYQTVSKDCMCTHLDRINFPIFQPSINDFRAAELRNFYSGAGSNLQSSCNELRISANSVQTLSIAKLWGTSGSALGINGGVTPHSHLTDNINHLVLNSDQENHHDRPLVRQASTTEYLPTMLHTESPLGLLPQFPSWSLVCRGPSSLYSHNVGLQDQSGFIPGSAYLLPWDVTIRQKERCWPTVSEVPCRRAQNPGRGCSYRKYRGPRDLFSVKIFVGTEYECLRGHRFMSSGPGKVLKASGSGLVKENATKITKGNMPLYLPCPCSKAISQLMRIHIVTPKAPVFVTVNPKVRPAPAPCPIFVTGAQKPTPLSQSAYWVLRLPFVYAGERETYVIPKEPTQLNYGELLGPMYGITEVSK